MPSGLAAISKASDFLNLLDIWSRSSGAIGGLGADPAARRAHRDQALQGQGLVTRFLKGLQWGVLEQNVVQDQSIGGFAYAQYGDSAGLAGDAACQVSLATLALATGAGRSRTVWGFRSRVGYPLGVEVT